MQKFPIDTAATSWEDGDGVHIRVYWSDGYTVKERCFDSGNWTDGEFSQQGSQVSAISWQDGSGLHLRVYCTFQDQAAEWCWDQGTGWVQGGFTLG
jgi:hypothetical protein